MHCSAARGRVFAFACLKHQRGLLTHGGLVVPAASKILSRSPGLAGTNKFEIASRRLLTQIDQVEAFQLLARCNCINTSRLCLVCVSTACPNLRACEKETQRPLPPPDLSPCPQPRRNPRGLFPQTTWRSPYTARASSSSPAWSASWWCAA